MEITLEFKNELEEIYQSLFNDNRVRRMLEIPMHRGSNCFLHSFKVAKKAIHRALNKKSIDLKVLLYGAILHDYYLYDWRKDKSKRKSHGRSHPIIAADQAKKDFDIPDEAASIIRSHMWPLNFKLYPKNKEAKLLSFSDKSIAIKEFFSSSKRKQKNREKEMKYISTLF